MIARGSYKERILKICLNAELNGLLLLDEFQFIQGISTMLKLLTDKFGNLRILCSGSSSLYILQNIEESLMGRVRVIEVLSLSLDYPSLINFADDEKLSYVMYLAPDVLVNGIGK